MYSEQGIPAARVEEWMKLLPDNKVPKLGGPGESYRENQLRHPHFPSLCNRAIFNKFSFKMLPGLSIYLVSLAPSGLLLPSHQ